MLHHTVPHSLTFSVAIKGNKNQQVQGGWKTGVTIPASMEIAEGTG